MSHRTARTVSFLILSVSLAPGTVPSILQMLNKNVLKEGKRQGNREGGRETRREEGSKMWKEGI